MKQLSLVRLYLFVILMVFTSSMKAAVPSDDNTSPYFEDAATRDLFMNCKKTIWTNNWDDLPTNQPNKNYVQFENDVKYGNMKFRRLRNRHALTGDSCTVNKLIGVVGVGSWTKDLGALTDDTLDNYAQVNAVIKAGVTVDPIVSVRDQANYYSKGTVAGYTIVAGSGSSVLTLDVIKTYSIGFYRDGKLLGVKAVREGQDGSGVTLKLIQIPGSNDVCASLTAESDWLFDEITLDRSGGIQADVADLMKIKYAFVGESTEFTITDGGIANYNTYYENDKQMSLSSMRGWNPVGLGIPFDMDKNNIRNMTDDNLDNYGVITPVLSIGYQGGARFIMKNDTNPNEEVFSAGMEAGFKYKMGAALGLKAGAWIQMILYDHNGKEVQSETVSAEVLNLTLVQAGDGTMSIKAKQPFSGCEIKFLTVLGVDLGAMGIHYGFVKLAPDVSHHCNIEPSMSTNICESQTTFSLLSNPEVSVTWKLTGAWDPDGNDILASTNVKVNSDGEVTNLEPGKYTFTATAADGCSDETTITVGGFGGGNTNCGKPIVNGMENGTYELTSDLHSSSGSLLSVSNLKNPENILSDNMDTYADYVGGLSLADNLCIIGVHRTDGLIYDATDRQDGESENEAIERAKPKRVGFVVAANAKVLNLSALQFLQVRCYHNGKEVYRHLIDENNAVNADIAGSDQLQKIRYSIEIPAYDADNNQTQVDEIMLWTSGVLNLGGSELRIYYAFIENSDDECSSPISCSSHILSYHNSHTTINANATQFGGAVNVATVDDNLGHLVDGDLNTYMAVANSVSVGVGQTFAVNMGRTVDYHNQLGIVIDNKTFLAAINVGNWLTIKTYRDGVETGDEYTDWNAISANVAGFGDKNILFLQPKLAYDEIRLTIGKVIGALDVQKFYGIVLRGDVDNDGIPDCQDPSSCTGGVTDVKISEVCAGDNITVTATGFTGAKYYLHFSDNTAGNKGLVELTSTSDTKNNIQYTYTTKKSGEYQLVIYDGSGTPLNSIIYKVHPLQTRWLKTASTNEWNKWDNWSNGAPYCCTNAIISSDAKHFPVLGTVEDPTDYCCKDIYFEPNSAVENVPSLNYRKAWVDMALNANKYYNLSIPLKNTYTGDMFIPADTTTAKYFEDLTADNWTENRFNPSFYQRLWATAAPGKIISTDSKGNVGLADETLGVLSTQWSHNFNAVAKNYGMGEGFALWVDNGSLPASNTFRIRLPKTHTTYHYYADYNQEVLGSEDIARDAATQNRFIYETDDANNKTYEYTYKLGDANVTENRTVYDAQDEYQITLKADEATNTFLMGNPFMSHLNIAKFLEANSSNVASIQLQNPDGNSEQAVSLSGGILSSTGSLTEIAPMRSFLVTTQGDASTETTILLTKDMIGGSASKALTSSREELVEASGLLVKMELLESKSKSSMLLVAEDGMTEKLQPVCSLFDDEVTPKAKVCGIQESQAYDILPITVEKTPLCLYLESKDSVRLSFEAHGDIDLQDYLLVDQWTQETWPLSSSIVIPKAETSFGRFAVKSSHVTGIDQPSSETSATLMIQQEGDHALVRSDNVGIEKVEVIGMDGKKYHQVYGHSAKTMSVPLKRGLQILCVTLQNKKVYHYKIASRQ